VKTGTPAGRTKCKPQPPNDFTTNNQIRPEQNEQNAISS
jgi:hypothetical protein